MNDPKIMSDILQEIKNSLNFVYGIRSDCIDDELLKMGRCKGKMPLIVRKRDWPWRSARNFAATGARTMTSLRNGVMKSLPGKKVLRDEPAV